LCPLYLGETVPSRIKKANRILSEAGKIALKSKNDEELSEESFEKCNGDKY
jgi:hypothetical protein